MAGLEKKKGKLGFEKTVKHLLLQDLTPGGDLGQYDDARKTDWSYCTMFIRVQMAVIHHKCCSMRSFKERRAYMRHLCPITFLGLFLIFFDYIPSFKCLHSF